MKPECCSDILGKFWFCRRVGTFSALGHFWRFGIGFVVWAASLFTCRELERDSHVEGDLDAGHLLAPQQWKKGSISVAAVAVFVGQEFPICKFLNSWTHMIRMRNRQGSLKAQHSTPRYSSWAISMPTFPSSLSEMKRWTLKGQISMNYPQRIRGTKTRLRWKKQKGRSLSRLRRRRRLHPKRQRTRTWTFPLASGTRLWRWTRTTWTRTTWGQAHSCITRSPFRSNFDVWSLSGRLLMSLGLCRLVSVWSSAYVWFGHWVFVWVERACSVLISKFAKVQGRPCVGNVFRVSAPTWVMFFGSLPLRG